MTNSGAQYREKRVQHWDRLAEWKNSRNRLGEFYQALLKKYYGLMVPPGLNVLELGCCNGDLLHSLNPATGVGIDFSGKMIRIAGEKYPNLRFIQADAHE